MNSNSGQVEHSSECLRAGDSREFSVSDTEADNKVWSQK